MNNIFKFLIIMGVFLALDMLWLTVIAKNLYKKYLGYIMSDKPKIIAAFIFYVIFVVGILAFVVNPALQKQSLLYALGFGALFGFITYSTYDLTNLATVKDWPVKITMIDLVWGTSVSAATSTLSYLIISAIW
jgi:uncharacterized membrane protein